MTLAKNEAGRIAECLQSVAWADERIVVDDESADRTAQIAASLGARVLSRKMDVEGRHRNWAAQQARNDWILSVDADERVTPELAEEIRSLFNSKRGQSPAGLPAGSVAGLPADASVAGTVPSAPTFQVYSIPRRNFLGPRWLRHGGWYPSAQVKLYNRRVFRWEETTVHCRALSDQRWGVLRGDLLHYSYRDIGDFLAKLNRQTTLEAEKWLRDGRRMTCLKALWRTADRFFRAYVGKKGYRDGWIGFVAAVLAGLYQLVSFAKYWEAKRPSERVSESASKREIAHSLTHPFAHSDSRSSLAVVLMTRNEESRLARCLEQVKGWADEIVVVDDESTDRTAEIARGYAAKVVIQRSHDNHDRQWNLGIEKASSEWILHIDADEIVTPALKAAIDRALARADGVTPPPGAGPKGLLSSKGPASPAATGGGVSAYDLMRLNFFLGRPMRHGGWRHRHRILFRRSKARCVGRGIHVRLQVDGPVRFLDAEIEHHPFQSVSQFMDRQNHYTTVEAEVMLREKGRLPWKTVRKQLFFRPWRLFWKSFLKQGGWREGAIGFFFAALFAYFHHALWAKYWEKAEAA